MTTIDIKDIIWYVVTSNKGRDRTEGYPLNIYADEKLAREVAQSNNEKLVMVKKVKDLI